MDLIYSLSPTARSMHLNHGSVFLQNSFGLKEERFTFLVLGPYLPSMLQTKQSDGQYQFIVQAEMERKEIPPKALSWHAIRLSPAFHHQPRSHPCRLNSNGEKDKSVNASSPEWNRLRNIVDGVKLAFTSSRSVIKWCVPTSTSLEESRQRFEHASTANAKTER